MADRKWRRRRLSRFLGVVFVSSAVVLGWLFMEPWTPVYFTPQLRRGALVGVLVGLKVAYPVVLAVNLIAIVTLTGLFLWARGTGTRRPMVARGLLLCCACLFSFAFAETIASRWRAPSPFVPSPASTDPALPERFTERDDPSETTILVLGESSAAGAPFEAWLSVGRIVAWQLGEVMPKRRFSAYVLAQPGDTLEKQYLKLSCIKRRPGVMIIYCGHNEFFARIPWSRNTDHYLDERPPLPIRLVDLGERASPLCGLIQQSVDHHRVGVAPPAKLHPPLVDVPAFTPAEFAENLADFRRRLEKIISYGDRVGALPILVVPPGNDAGFEPLRSFLPATTTRIERDEFARDFLAARSLEESDPNACIEKLRVLLSRQPGFAECHYRLAHALEKTGMWDEAYLHYVAARDLDGLPVRCLNAFQQVYQDLAAAHRCLLVDGQALFHAIGRHGQLDDSLFQDAMHPSLRGHIAIAQGILDALRSRRLLDWPGDSPTPTIDPGQCAAHFGLTSSGWKKVCEWGEMFYSAVAAMRYDPSQCRAKQSAYKEALRRLDAGERAEVVGLPNVGIPAKLPTAGGTSELHSGLGWTDQTTLKAPELLPSVRRLNGSD